MAKASHNPSNQGALGRWTDDTERDEYRDMDYGPRNMGRIRPNQAEWGDYIQDAQQGYLADLSSGSIELPKVKYRNTKRRREYLSIQQFPESAE
jgi:hypothetical protein